MRWALRGYQVRADNGLGKHVATWQTCEADGRLLAAAPELLDMVLEAIEALDEVSLDYGDCTSDKARELRERLTSMRLR